MANNEYWVYYYDSNTWESLPPMKEKHWKCQAALIYNKIYVTGGKDRYNNQGSVEVFNCRTQLWTLSPTMMNSHSNHTSVTVKGEIYIFGGFNKGYRYPTNKCERWNTASNTSECWTEIPNMPYKADGCAAVAKEKNIYLMRGYKYHDKYINTVVYFMVGAYTEWYQGKVLGKN